MADLPEPTVQATRYLVSCLPEGHADRDLFTVQVEYRNHNRWAVKNRTRSLSADGTWSWSFNWSGGPEEPITDDELASFDKEQAEWLTQHRFDLDTALALAKVAAKKLTCRGYTVADAIAGSFGV